MLKNKLFLFLFLIHFFTFSQDNISFISWNIRDFGKTKNKEELDRIADIVRDVDIVALQEVVAGPGGTQAIAHLADILNRKGVNGTMSSAILPKVLNTQPNATLFFGKLAVSRLKKEVTLSVN